ncbi:MAG: hypothetical protein WBM83_12740 [Flavobacteriaceae bacterium]
MKNLKTPIFSIVAIALLLLLGCSKGDENTDPEKPNNNPGLFSAKASGTVVDGATIEWTESKDSDDDQVTYAILLEGKVVSEGISAMTYTFTGLEADTNYSGYVESRDGKGGTNKADFSFKTAPEILIMTVPLVIKEFEAVNTACLSGIALEIDAGVLVPKYPGNVTYSVQFGVMTFGWNNSTVGAVARTWTNDNFQPYYIYDYDAENFFVWQAGAGGCSDAEDNTVRDRYATATGEAIITIVIGD